MADIVKARNQGNNSSPVCVPLYGAPLGCAWDAIATYQIVNTAIPESVAGSRSIRCKVETTAEYLDIEGRTVGMISKIGDEVFRDVVTIVGMTGTAFVVRFGDEDTEYSVRKSVVRFVEGVNE